MTALTLTPDPGAASVLLEVTGATAPAITITRADDNGISTVRLRANQVPIGGALTIEDYEPALTGTITYTVDDDGTPITETTSLAGDVPGPVIADIQQPQDAAQPAFVDGYRASVDSGTVVHWPIGRPDPVVVLRPRRLRAGTLTVFAESHAAAHAMLPALEPGRRLMLRQVDHPGLDMYFVALRTDLAPREQLHNGWVWSVTVDYVETRNPNLPLIGAAGWTFADLTAGYPTFSAVRTTFADFADLTAGTPA